MSDEIEKPKKETCENAIIRVFQSVPVGAKLAVHEFDSIKDHNQNAIATKLSQMALRGRVDSEYRPGKRYKHWWFISSLLVMLTAGCGGAPKRAPEVIWGPVVHQVKANNGCFALVAGFKTDATMTWRASQVECPKPVEAKPKKAKAK